MTQPRLITRHEALGTHTPDQIRACLNGRRWFRVLDGVYAIGNAPLDPSTRIAAALLVSAPGTVAVRESAATLHGFGVLTVPGVQLGSVCVETARTRAGITMHAMHLTWSDIARVNGMACTNAARTAIDLARLVDRIDGLPVLDAALRVGACTDADLKSESERQRGLRGIVQARGLVKMASRYAESPMESRTRLRILDAGFPPPTLQICVGPYRLDLGWEELRIGVEYDGIDHLDRWQQRWDLERRRYLTTAGWSILTVTDVDIYRSHVRFLSQLRQAFAAASR